MQLRRLKRVDEPQDTTAATQLRLAKAVDALQFLVEQNSSVFEEVENLLKIDIQKPMIHTLTPADKDRARVTSPALYDAWESLVRTDDYDEVRRQWTGFAREFLKACNLYYGERDDQRRFTTVPSVKYPFSVFQTAFYKPQSEFLKRPLRLYLYRHQDVNLQALQRLEAELSGEDSAACLHIVFAPQGFERIQRYFSYDTGFKDFLLVDEAFLFRVLLAEKHDVPVRRALHASVTDLASSSPFVAQGYCHQSNNIYVGRKEVLQKLLNTPQAMIWGGRRIGKTSVLHALENSLRQRNYRVAYVYVDIDDAGNPDLAIARKICATLDLPPAETITDFERHVTTLRSGGTRIAFLIDEVDEYIKKSRAVHGDAFPLATTLRQLVMDDSAKDTRLVYSGYHQLYYEAKLDREKRRVGHPFINTGQDVPIGNLLIDDVKDLLTTGFEDMLDIAVNPDVPSLIFRRASGHPAFIQQFCRCLLEWLSKRRSRGTRPTVTVEDVEAVYAASVRTEVGGEPFIFYVDETLGYNLSHLGRAMMLAICDPNATWRKRPSKSESFSLHELHNEVDTWCDIATISPTNPAHFTQTVELLVMTNMLTQDQIDHDRFRVTYPAYIDILQRLNKLGRTEIVQSLDKYDKKERQKGVLL